MVYMLGTKGYVVVVVVWYIC